MSFQKLSLDMEDGTTLYADFNPEKISIAQTGRWKAKPATGKAAPPGQEYVGGGAAKLTLDLLFDSTESGRPVTNTTKYLDRLVMIDTSSSDYDPSNKTGRPQWVKVIWGKIPTFPWICKSLTVNYTYFDTKGMPLRAMAKLGLEQFTDPAAKKGTNPTSGTPRPHKLHTVRRGETLDRIASSHYGTASKWRMIAEANLNAIDDPIRLTPGTVLVIPDRRGRQHG